MSTPATTERRITACAALLLGGAVVFGAVFLGAPPRFSGGDAGPAWLREFLACLGPLTIVEAAVPLALGGLVAAQCLRHGSLRLPGGAAAARTRLPLLLLFALGLAQLVPIPSGMLSVVAPFSARTYASLTAVGDDTMHPISLWPAGTAHALFNLAGVIAASALISALVRGDRARRAATWLFLVVAAFATAEAATGLCATKFGDDLLLGTFEKASDNGRVTGTFIHATMMAVWAGMGACAALGLAAKVAWDGAGRARAAVAVAAAALCTTASIFTLSRLGWIAVAAGVLTTWILIAFGLLRAGRRGAARAMGVAAVLFVAGAAIVMFAVPAFRDRMDLLFTERGVADDRFPMWRSAWALWRESPLLGTGLGSFGRAIHLTQSPDCQQELWFAHCDPLNLLCDVGVVGALLAAWWIAASIRRGLAALGSDDAGTRCLAAGAFGAAVVVLVSSLGDFQTQFPVVAIPFAALLTLPAALAGAAPSVRSDEPGPGEASPTARLLAGCALVVAAVVAAIPIAACAARAGDLAATGSTGATASEALVAQGRALLERLRTSRDPKGDLANAEAMLREAARRDPLLDQAHLWTGLAALCRDEPRDDVLRALGRARLVARGHAQTNLLAGSTYLDLIGTEPAPYGPPGDGAIAALREAAATEPKAFSAAWAACLARGQSLDVLRAITPERGYAQAYLFDHLRSIGREEEAIALLEDQLTREPWDAAVATRLAQALTEAGRTSEGRSFFDSVGAHWPR